MCPLPCTAFGSLGICFGYATAKVFSCKFRYRRVACHIWRTPHASLVANRRVAVCGTFAHAQSAEPWFSSACNSCIHIYIYVQIVAVPDSSCSEWQKPTWRQHESCWGIDYMANEREDILCRMIFYLHESLCVRLNVCLCARAYFALSACWVKCILIQYVACNRALHA